MNKPTHRLSPIFPLVVISLSVDTFYEFLKYYSGGFTWSFEIKRDEVYPIQAEVLDFLSDKGKFRLELVCQKYGELEAREFSVEGIRRTELGWEIFDTY